MNTNEVNINIDAVIPSSRGIGSNVGSLLGQPYFKVESRVCWPGNKQGWDETVERIRNRQTTQLIPNREINRFRLTEHNIRSAQYYKNIAGEVGIVINLQSDGTYDMFFPLTKDALRIGRTANEAVAAALRGEGDNFFLNAKITANLVNEANKSELANVRALKEALNKIEQNLIGAISDNEKLAITVSKEVEETKISDVDLGSVICGANSAHVEVHANISND